MRTSAVAVVALIAASCTGLVWAAAPPDGDGEAGGPPEPMTQAQVKEALARAGMQQVRILREQFVVRAVTAEGEQVILLLRPTATGLEALGPKSLGAAPAESDGSEDVQPR